jgi:ribosomal protein L7/L12
MMDFTAIRAEIHKAQASCNAWVKAEMEAEAALRAILADIDDLESKIHEEQENKREALNFALPNILKVIEILKGGPVFNATLGYAPTPKVAAIKYLRHLTGWSLVEAKEYVDLIAERI